MSIDFFTPSRMTEFWEFVKMLLETIMPGIMIVFATVAVGLLLRIVVNLYKKSDKEQDEEDYEVRRY